MEQRQLRELLERAPTQVGGILTHGDRVQIGEKIKAVKFVRAILPVADGAQIGAEGQVAGRLDAGEHSFFCLGFRHDFSHLSDFCFYLIYTIIFRRFLQVAELKNIRGSLAK